MAQAMKPVSTSHIDSIFRRLYETAKSDYLASSFHSARMELGSNWTDFQKM
jgi:hypothetical protein